MATEGRHRCWLVFQMNIAQNEIGIYSVILKLIIMQPLYFYSFVSNTMQCITQITKVSKNPLGEVTKKIIKQR